MNPSFLKSELSLILTALLVIGAAFALTTSATAGPGASAVKPAADTRLVQSPGKQRAPVRLEHALASKPELGLPVELRLVVLCDADCTALGLALNATQGLTLDRGVEAVPLRDANRGESREVSVWVTPVSVGRHYVNVTVNAEFGGAPGMRAFAIPLEIGDTGSRKVTVHPGLRVDSDGRQVLVMPARERPGD